LRTTARIISILFHPLFVIGYVLVLLLSINPYLFVIQDNQAKFLLIFSVVMLTIFFPIFSIFMMKMLDLIGSFQMKEKSERIGPLIVTGTFYLWLFINIKDNSNILPFGSFNVHTNLVLLMVIVIAGAVGTSRLLLKAHDTMDVYGGYIVGIFAQIVAFRIMVG